MSASQKTVDHLAAPATAAEAADDQRLRAACGSRSQDLNIPRQTRVLELRTSTARADGLLLHAYDGLARSAAEECVA
jgi:hypothetical protein